MVKRKRNVPKRKRRKRKFGLNMVEKAKAAAAAAKAKLAEAAGGGKALFVKHGGGSILKILASDELQLFVIKEGPTKEILESLQKDCKNGDVDFKLTIGYFKEQVTQKKDEAKSIVEERKTKLKKSFYDMLKAKQINAKAEEQWVKATNKALSSISSPGKELLKAYMEEKKLSEYSTFTGIIENTYKSKKDEKRVAFNILGSLLTNTADDANVFKANFIEDLENLGKKVINEGTKKPKTPASTFGKRKRGPSASLKRMCKKHGVRLMVKRGKTRVYKSSKVLKEQCQNKLKRKLKKNFGRKKIKRSGIMPPKRKTRGKKRSRLSSAARGAKRRVSAAARYARRNPGTAALGGLAGLGTLGLGAYEGYAKYKRSQGDGSYYSPTGEAFKRVKGGAADVYVYFKDTPIETIKEHIMALPEKTKRKVFDAVSNAKWEASQKGYGLLDRIFPKSSGAISRKNDRELRTELNRLAVIGTDGRMKYGKRRRRKRKSSFGKAKKPSAATRRMCKRLKVKMTLKRGGKRVYKSEAMLKKQCKKAMKRKSKK